MLLSGIGDDIPIVVVWKVAQRIVVLGLSDEYRLIRLSIDLGGIHYSGCESLNLRYRSWKIDKRLWRLCLI